MPPTFDSKLSVPKEDSLISSGGLVVDGMREMVAGWLLPSEHLLLVLHTSLQVEEQRDPSRRQSMIRRVRGWPIPLTKGQRILSSP